MQSQWILFLYTILLCGVPHELLGQYHVINYDTKDGFPRGERHLILEDFKGYIWTAGEQGLYRFNGKVNKFYSLREANGKFGQHRKINGLCKCEDGTIYVTNSNGLWKFNEIKDRFENLIENANLIAYKPLLSSVSSILCKNGFVYLGTHVGLLKYDLERNKIDHVDLNMRLNNRGNYTNHTSITTLQNDRVENDLLVITGNGYIGFYNTKTQELEHVHTIQLTCGDNFEIGFIIWISQYNILFGTDRCGVIHYDMNRHEVIHETNPKSDVSEYTQPSMISLEDYDQNYFASTHKEGLPFLIDKETFESKPLNLNNVGSNHEKILKSQKGDLWFVGRNGLMRLNKDRYEIIPLAAKEKDFILNTIFSTDGNYALISYSNSELHLYENLGDTLVHSGWEQKGLNSWYDRERKEFLIQHGEYVISIDPKTKTENKLSLSLIQKVANIAVNESYIAITGNHAINIYDETKKLIFCDTLNWPPFTSDILMPTRVGFIERDIIYVLNDERLILIDINKESQIYYDLPKVLHPFQLLKHNNYWIIDTKSSGLFRLDLVQDSIALSAYDVGNRFHSYEQGSIDDEGRLWRVRGVEVVVTAFDNSERLEDLFIYNIEGVDGYIDIVPSITDKGIFFSDLLHVIRFDQPNIPDTIIPPIITHYKVLDSTIISTQYQTFNSWQNTIEIFWDYPFMDNRKLLNYKFKLEGWDSDWRYENDINSIRYSNLAPGDYSFQIKMEIYGASSPIVSLPFRIRPPWYKSWIFLVICLVVLISLLNLISQERINGRIRRANIEKELAELELKALRSQLSPRFIFNSLDYIKELITHNNDDKAVETLLLFSKVVRGVLKYCELDSISLEEELEFSRNYLTMVKLKYPEKFDFEIRCNETELLNQYRVPPLLIHAQLYKAVYEGVLLHTIKSHIVVEPKKLDNGLEVSISYNIPSKDNYKSNIDEIISKGNHKRNLVEKTLRHYELRGIDIKVFYKSIMMENEEINNRIEIVLIDKDSID